MRPPMAMPSMPASTGLQPTEVHPVQQVHLHATPSNPSDIHQDRSPHNHHAKLPPLELLVENKISYSSYQQHAKDLNHQSHNQNRSKRSSLSSPSSSEDCVSAARASIFDDAAENFVINFPSESASSQHLLPLSETVPLLTHIEATVVDKQRSIRLNKNSASLIFTKKELTQGTHHHQHNNHHHHHHQQQQQQRRPHHSSLYGVGRKPTKHLPPTRGQHQRRSLPLSYNNNLVTTAPSAGGGGGPGGAAKLVPLKQQHQHHGAGHTAPPTANVVVAGGAGAAAPSARKQLSYSWYAPVYSALEEELEQDSRDSSPIHNLANTKQHQRSASQKASTALHATPRHDRAHDSADAETVALLDTQARGKIIISSANGDTGGSGAGGGFGGGGGAGSGNGGVLAANGGGDLESSLGLSGGGQLPRRRRIENFLKSLVGLKASSSRGGGVGSVGGGGAVPERERPASPEIRITRTPSEQDVVLRDPSGRQLANGHGRGSLSISGSSSSLNVVQQKIWHIMRREGSASSLHQEKSQSIVQYTGLRKCETVLALTRQSQSHRHVHGLSQSRSQGHSLAVHGSGIFSSGGVEQIRPLNRLRNSVSSINGVGTCSRCSSLLSLAASGSRYSLSNGFVPRPTSALNHLEAGWEDDHRRSQEPHINVNAQIRLSGAATANSTSPSPPSNVTTATLHSSSANNLNQELQQSTSTPATTPTETPESGELGPFGTNHAYPLTVTSLLSMASANQAAQACCVRDGIALKRREMLASADVTPSVGTPATPTTAFQSFTCKLCLIDVEDVGEAMALQQCGCQFCIEIWL
ncbi:uncharacterized protein Dyak_GE13078, isoform D [Drosophila yakuba]|uniref:Uncharacterized protein, isoform D n=1 Tax=Drosophila yakuba TaxID=7245 RepID=A0A0R1DUR9_DROYA|nr:uncharacterized protein Dyak_GE13078, isoform D [Drosophila yakuba]